MSPTYRSYGVWHHADLYRAAVRDIEQHFAEWMREDDEDDWMMSDGNRYEPFRRLLGTKELKAWIAENRVIIHDVSPEGRTHAYPSITLHCRLDEAMDIEGVFVKLGQISFADDADAVKFKLQMSDYRLTLSERAQLADS